MAALMAAPGGTGAATSTSTVGQNSAPPDDDARCFVNFTLLQRSVASGNPYSVGTAGVITSWSFQTGSSAVPDLKLKVARPQSNGSYLFLGEAAAGAQTLNAVNTYPANIAVQAGDIIGFHGVGGVAGVPCATKTADANDVLDVFVGDPAVGTAPLSIASSTPYRLPVSATVTTTTPDHSCKGKPATIVGTRGNDVRTGTPGPDVMVGLGGNDKLSGRGGKDLICGGAGKDKLKGGAGKDTLLGQKGKDKLNGGAGKDFCKGGKGRDTASKCEVRKSI
jgi:Ca2+-binding RTX toxin-like protein